MDKQVHFIQRFECSTELKEHFGVARYALVKLSAFLIMERI